MKTKDQTCVSRMISSSLSSTNWKPPI